MKDANDDHSNASMFDKIIIIIIIHTLSLPWSVHLPAYGLVAWLDTSTEKFNAVCQPYPSC